ncbi:MAG: hypothetical protein AAGF72_19705 [Pseudomonadota bacterium]
MDGLFRIVSCLLVMLGGWSANIDAGETTDTPRTVSFDRLESTEGEPPRRCQWYVSFPDKIRQEFASGVVIVTDHRRGRVVVIDHNEKTVTTATTRQSSADAPVDLYAEMLSVDEGTRAEAQDTTIGGREALAYQEHHGTWSQTMWVDAETRRPLRMVHEFTPTTRPVTKSVAENFRFNAELERHLCDVTAVPATYAVVKSEEQAKEELWQTY